MAIIGEKITLDKPLVGNIARNQMESKMELATRGALYVGTGNKTEVTPDGGGDKVPIPETLHIAPNGASDNGKVLVADSKETVGWKITKITADNLEGGRVAQATNADQATKADTVSYNGDYKSFIDAFVSACLLKIYPIGSIYMSVNDVNPSTFLGGTWEPWGSGRVPVGVNASDADFATVEKVGGIKSDSFNHNHRTIFAVDDEAYYYLRSKSIRTPSSGGDIVSVASFELTNIEGGSGPDNWNNITTGRAPYQGEGPSTTVTTLQPYITCFMWKRTA